MKTFFKSLFLMVSILAMLTLMPGGFAHASPTPPPTREYWHWFGEEYLDCGDFVGVDYTEYTWTVTFFWNDDGTLDRYRIHGEIIDRLTSPFNDTVINGRTQGYNFLEDVEAYPGVGQHYGLMFHWIIPGQGTVLIDAGIMDFNFINGEMVFLRGNHQYNNNTGELEKICDMLR
jgi:hypothetical protein